MLSSILIVGGNVGVTSSEYPQFHTCCGRDMIWRRQKTLNLVPFPPSRLRSHWADDMDVKIQPHTISEYGGNKIY